MMRKSLKRLIRPCSRAYNGGPLENIIAAKAVCFGEALKPEFKEYQKKVVENTKALANRLTELNIKLLTGGTDNHLVLLDLRGSGITGKELESRLEEVGIISNKNAVPFDEENKSVTSGLRLGAAAVTSRGLNTDDMITIADIIGFCVHSKESFEITKNNSKDIIKNLCEKYPLYKD